MPRSLLERFIEKVEIDLDSGCWEWIAACSSDGYGAIRTNGVTERASRVAYELFVGEIPDGLHIDHLCRNTFCVNPEHLEPVTCQENARRGNTGLHWRMRTHCPQGHPYNEENTIYERGHRKCRTCHYARNRARLQKRRKEIAS